MWRDEFEYVGFNKLYLPVRGITVCFDTNSGSSTQKTYTSGQKKVLGKALEVYGPTLGQGEKIYQGERVAPLTETQTQLADVQGFIDKFAPYRDIPLFGETGTALTNIMSGEMGAKPITAEDTESYFQGKIATPAYKMYKEDVLPAVKEAYAGPGYWGSARAKAQTESAQDLADWLGEQRSGLEWDVAESNRQIEEAKAGRALSAIQPAITYGGVPTAEAQQRLAGRAGALELAGVPQAQQQTEINAAIQKFAEENRITSEEDMAILMNLLGLSYSKASSTGAGLGYTALASLLGGAGQGFGYGAGQGIFTE
jgi:hypothetical protein